MWRAFVYGNGKIGQEDRARQVCDKIRLFGAIFDTQNPSICQDRLGTDIRKAEQKRCFCMQAADTFLSLDGKFDANVVIQVKNGIFCSVSPMFVPSLSWQNHRFNV
jgi:alpha-glucuronidase